MANCVESSSDCRGPEEPPQPDTIGEPIPPAGAFLFAGAVVICSLLVVAIAIFEISESRGWRLAPVFLERMLR